MSNRYRFSLAGALLLAASAAQAAGPNFGFERLRLDPAAVSSLVIGTGEVAPEGGARVSAAAHWEQSPLVLHDGAYWGKGVTGAPEDPRTNIVGDRITVHLGAAVSITKDFEANLSVPIIAWQKGSPDTSLPSLPKSSIGTPTLGLRYVVLHQEDAGLNVAAAGEVGPALGEDPAYGTSKFWTFTPRLELGHRFGRWVLGGQLGALVRSSPIQVNDDTIGTELTWGVVAATINKPLRFEVSLRGNLASRSLEQSAEALVGVRYQFCKAFEAFALGGPGFYKEPGTPTLRGVFGIAYTGAPTAAPPPPVKVDPCGPGVIHTPEQCPNLDDDGDGIKNADDACPLVPGIPELNGCPDKDSDGDGVPDRLDKCPDVPGLKELDGCPAKDSDGDGIPDHLDKCPDVPGVPEYQGCPPPKAVVNVATKKIDIMEKVYFDIGKSTIQDRSYPLLDEVAQVLKDHTEIDKVLVEGHTDSTGPAAFNRKLSADRAAAVKAYLASKGVPAERLDTRGFGPDKPVGSNGTAAGREQNRRVEFTIQ
jgi:outer membrane protein OmpA-like peptidoglycan-associated protein